MSALLAAIDAELAAAEAELTTATQRALRARSLALIARGEAPVVSLEALAAEVDDDPEEAAYEKRCAEIYHEPPAVDYQAATAAREVIHGSAEPGKSLAAVNSVHAAHDEAIAAHLQAEGIASWNLAAITGISQQDTTAALGRLVDAGRAVKTGSHRATRYSAPVTE